MKTCNDETLSSESKSCSTHRCIGRTGSFVCRVTSVALFFWLIFRPGARDRPDCNFRLASICDSRLTKIMHKK